MPALPKPPKGSATRARRKTARKRKQAVIDQKALARERDRYCRFPLCGCQKAPGAPYSRLECSHDVHVGSGGQASGTRSQAAVMLLLCNQRHQSGIISRDRKTLRTRYLTGAKNDGPIAWEVRLLGMPLSVLPLAVLVPAMRYDGDWVEVARETAPHELAPLEPWQRQILQILSEMSI